MRPEMIETSILKVQVSVNMVNFCLSGLFIGFPGLAQVSNVIDKSGAHLCITTKSQVNYN